MDFLKSAVASAISKGPPFPYSFGDKLDIEQSIWTLYNGTKREDGSNCSIFSFDVVANRARLPIARNAVRKLRTLRHPGVIKVLDTVETDTYIYVATERLVPLRWHIKRKSLSPETIKWGLNGVATTVKFINNDASSIHGNLKAASVYTSESGEWKLGGFELVSNVKDDDAVIYNYGSLMPDSARYAAPELARDGWNAIKSSPHTAVDSFNFAGLIFEVFNGEYTGADQAGQPTNVPPSMQSSYRRLVNPVPKGRLSVGHFLDQGRRSGSFFDSPLIKLTDGVDNLGVKTQEEREAFLDDLDQLTDDFPEDFFKMKVLPELLKSVEFGGGGPKALAVVLKIAGKLSNEDFDSRVTPVIVRLFGNPDRAVRVALLDSMPNMIDRLQQRIVNDKIWPQVVSGFTDVQPVLREKTLISVLTFVSKLSDRTINGELLRCLAKTANDEQPGIRTNTTICLGKLAKNLGTSTRAKVLIAAFLRSLRDPFVHARNAALSALAATSEYFSEEDCASKLLPAMCPLLIDKEKPVRDQASKTVDLFLARIRKAASTMPDSVLPPPQSGDSSTGTPRMGTPQPNGQSAGSWAGWAVSSFTNKISAAAGDIEIQSDTPTSSRPGSVPPDLKKAPTPSTSVSALHRQALASPTTSTPALSHTSSQFASAMADEFLPAGSDHGDDAWGGFDENEAPGATSPATSTASFQTKPSTGAGINDGSEPDFAGWLAAQAAKKTTVAKGKALPRGLTKASPSASAAASRKVSSSSSVAAKPAPKPKVVKKVEPKPKAADEDAGWGDDW